MRHDKKFRMSDDEWDYYEPREDRKRAKKEKRRHHSRDYDEYQDDAFSMDDGVSYAEYTEAVQDQPKQRQFQYNEAFTIEVKNYKIDLSKVKSITVEDTVYNGRKSYGIRFDFMGNKGYGRDVWYGTNSKQRDEEYTKYLALWNNAPKNN